MSKYILATACTLALTGAAAAEHFFANVTAVDAARGTVVFKVTAGKKKGQEIKAKLAPDCVIREGSYRLGKPAKLIERVALDELGRLAEAVGALADDAVGGQLRLDFLALLLAGGDLEDDGAAGGVHRGDVGEKVLGRRGSGQRQRAGRCQDVLAHGAASGFVSGA